MKLVESINNNAYILYLEDMFECNRGEGMCIDICSDPELLKDLFRKLDAVDYKWCDKHRLIDSSGEAYSAEISLLPYKNETLYYIEAYGLCYADFEYARDEDHEVVQWNKNYVITKRTE